MYDACEFSSWYGAGRHDSVGTLKIIVDGETWPHLLNDPTVQAQSKFLLIDARHEIWRLYEQVVVRGLGVHPGTAQVTGVLYSAVSGDYKPIESNSVYIPSGETHNRWEMDTIQQGRIVRVALTVLLLIQSDKVRITPNSGNGSNSWKVTLPAGVSVNEIVSEVQERAASQGSTS